MVPPIAPRDLEPLQTLAMFGCEPLPKVSEADTNCAAFDDV